jgi:hypothetical protein
MAYFNRFDICRNRQAVRSRSDGDLAVVPRKANPKRVSCRADSERNRRTGIAVRFARASHMMVRADCCVYDRAIVQWLPDGSTVTIAQFSGHWAACAAMIRLTQPGFVSLGGDRADDLAIEAAMVLSA